MQQEKKRGKGGEQDCEELRDGVKGFVYFILYIVYCKLTNL